MTPATSSTTTPATSSTSSTTRRRWPWVLLGVVLGGGFVLFGLLVLGVIAYMREQRERPVIPFNFPRAPYPPERPRTADDSARAKGFDA